MDVLLYIVISIVALGVGIFIGRKSVSVDGMFIIDDANDEVTRWILDMREDPESIKMKDEIRLKVKTLATD